MSITVKGKSQVVGPYKDYEDLIKKKYEEDYWTLTTSKLEEQKEIANMYQEDYSTIQKRSQYDITDAYNKFLQNELQIKQSSHLGTGFKDQASQQLESGFGLSKESIESERKYNLRNLNAQFSTQLGNIDERYAKYQTTLDKEIQTQAQTLQRINQLMFEKIEEDYGLGWDELVSQGYYEVGEDDKYGLTERGKLLFDKFLNASSGEESFDRWLLEQGYTSEYDKYLEDLGFYKNVIGGLESHSFDKNKYSENLQKEELYQPYTTENLKDYEMYKGNFDFLGDKKDIDKVKNLKDGESISFSKDMIYKIIKIKDAIFVRKTKKEFEPRTSFPKVTMMP